MGRVDPTEDALAAIASVLNQPRLSDPRRDDGDVGDDSDAADTMSDYQLVTVKDSRDLAPSRIAEIVAPSSAVTLAPEQAVDRDPDHYERFGPGPLDALRFCWRARRDESGDYFVDETIGATSRPISTGPIPRAQVISHIDARAADSFQRFEELKREMVQRHHVVEHDVTEARGSVVEPRALPDLSQD